MQSAPHVFEEYRAIVTLVEYSRGGASSFGGKKRGKNFVKLTRVRRQ